MARHSGTFPLSCRRAASQPNLVGHITPTVPVSRQFKEPTRPATPGRMHRTSRAPRGRPVFWSSPWAETPRRLLVRRAIAFFAAAALLAFLALDGAGYDLIVRQSVAFGIWVVIAVGFATGVLPRANLGRIALVPAIAVAALAAWMLLSFGWTASDGRTAAELARVLGYAGIAVLALASLNRDTFRAAAAGLSVAALGIAALAVASRLAPGHVPRRHRGGLAVPHRSPRLPARLLERRRRLGGDEHGDRPRLERARALRADSGAQPRRRSGRRCRGVPELFARRRRRYRGGPGRRPRPQPQPVDGVRPCARRRRRGGGRDPGRPLQPADRRRHRQRRGRGGRARPRRRRGALRGRGRS